MNKVSRNAKGVVLHCFRTYGFVLFSTTLFSLLLVTSMINAFHETATMQEKVISAYIKNAIMQIS